MVHCDSNRIAQTATRENLQGNEKAWRRESEIIINISVNQNWKLSAAGCYGYSLPDLCVCMWCVCVLCVCVCVCVCVWFVCGVKECV